MITAEMQTNATDVVTAFRAKAESVAAANGWTVTKAQDVMLGYLRDTDPDTAQMVAVSLLVAPDTLTA